MKIKSSLKIFHAQVNKDGAWLESNEIQTGAQGENYTINQSRRLPASPIDRSTDRPTGSHGYTANWIKLFEINQNLPPSPRSTQFAPFSIGNMNCLMNILSTVKTTSSKFYMDRHQRSRMKKSIFRHNRQQLGAISAVLDYQYITHCGKNWRRRK